MSITKNDVFGFLLGAMIAATLVGVFSYMYVGGNERKNDDTNNVVEEAEGEITRKELIIGSAGSDVLEVQDRLIELGSYGIVEFDEDERGMYGEQTQFYIMLFQLSQNIDPTGVVNAKTWEALKDPVKLSEEKIAELKQHIPIDDGFDKDDIYYSPSFKKTAYLTFDDGPHPTYTTQIIDVLEKYDAGATFFALGQNVDRHQDIVKQTAQNKRNIANHTYNHIDISQASEDAIRKEIVNTSEAIVRVTKQKPTCFRPPYGAISPDVRKKIDTAGLPVIMWDVDPQDWRDPGVDAIVEHVTNYTQNEEIILLHDGGGNREQTITALEKILKKMTADGWVFKSLTCI